MTVFGRDTIITCLQTLIFGPELARTALGVLADLQAKEDDPTIDAEPGKIVHEVRHGKAARTWYERYYGSADATPLYLILLSEVWRWTDDAALVRDLKGPAMLALEWIDKYGDRDGDGFVEYERRTERGLENQSWKDSWDSQRFHDGSLANAPIAPCEVQGYVYDAKRRIAELAREVWRERELATRLEREAEELRQRFDDALAGTAPQRDRPRFHGSIGPMPIATSSGTMIGTKVALKRAGRPRPCCRSEIEEQRVERAQKHRRRRGVKQQVVEQQRALAADRREQPAALQLRRAPRVEQQRRRR